MIFGYSSSGNNNTALDDDEGEDMELDVMRKAMMRRDAKKRSVVKAKKFEQKKPWEIEWQ